MEEEDIFINFKVPKELKERAEASARLQDRTLSSLMRLALSRYLESVAKATLQDKETQPNE